MNTLEGACAKPEAEIVDIVKEEVCKWYNIKPNVLFSRQRPEHIAWPRQVAMVLSAEFSAINLVKLGIMFQRDHGTIIHAMKRFADRCDTEPRVMETIAGLRKRIEERLNA
jgi:chromosomal replication initiator protein